MQGICLCLILALTVSSEPIRRGGKHVPHLQDPHRPPMGKISDMYNPYKMFWTPPDTSVCEITNVAPMTWVSPAADPGMQYMLIDGNTNINPENYRRSWFDAERFCELKNANLVNIKSAEVNTFVWCLAPMLENRWIGHRLTWKQSPDFVAEINERGGPGIGYALTGKDLQLRHYQANDAQVIGPKGTLVDRSAVLRKGKRTAGSVLLGGNYSDATIIPGAIDSMWLGQFSTAFFRFDSNSPATGMPVTYGNPLDKHPYATQDGYTTQEPWYENEPNNRRGKENCVEMGKAWSRHAPEGKWNDFDCEYQKAFVCSRVTPTT